MNSSLQTLRIPIGHSRWLQRASLIVILFALFCWQLVNVSWSISLLGTVAIAGLAIARLRRPQPLMVLSFHSGNGWQLSRSNSDNFAVELLPPMLVSPQLTALRFARKSTRPGFRERINVCLCGDAVPAGLHRKLRVVLNTGHYQLNREPHV